MQVTQLSDIRLFQDPRCLNHRQSHSHAFPMNHYHSNIQTFPMNRYQGRSKLFAMNHYQYHSQIFPMNHYHSHSQIFPMNRDHSQIFLVNHYHGRSQLFAMNRKHGHSLIAVQRHMNRHLTEARKTFQYTTIHMCLLVILFSTHDLLQTKINNTIQMTQLKRSNQIPSSMLIPSLPIRQRTFLAMQSCRSQRTRWKIMNISRC